MEGLFLFGGNWLCLNCNSTESENLPQCLGPGCVCVTHLDFSALILSCLSLDVYYFPCGICQWLNLPEVIKKAKCTMGQLEACPSVHQSGCPCPSLTPPPRFRISACFSLRECFCMSVRGESELIVLLQLSRWWKGGQKRRREGGEMEGKESEWRSGWEGGFYKSLTP